MSTKLSILLRVAMTLALVFGPRVAAAQKALVYCPTAIDASGCTTIKSALATAYPDGVDGGYDGTQGTVDLNTVDLFQYSVFLVPSLAESDSAAPYALLRNAAVAARLKVALLGRSAFWSGTPDQGLIATTRPQKDALIQNLAAWASADFVNVKGPGLVVLQDNSDDVTQRYSWVQAITGVNLVADPKLATYGSVRSLTAAGNAVLSSNGSTLAYANMASFGFMTPSGAAGVSMDAVGQTGTSVGGQIVLITQAGANTGGAVVKTDTDDYPPGTPVIMTGSGFGAGETVSLTLHEDPLLHPDRVYSVAADANGDFVYSSFAPEEHDIDVRFVLTALGQSSGRQAQTTFTDGQPQSVALTPGSVTVAPGAAASYTAAVDMGGNNNACTVTLSVTSVLPTGVSAAFSGGANPFNATNVDFSRTLTLTTTNTGPMAGRTPPGTYSFTLQVARGAGCQGSGNVTTTGTLVVGNVATSLALAAPSPSSVGYGSAGPVSFSATLTRTTGGTAVDGASIAFTVDGAAAGTATTTASGLATLAGYNPSSLTVGPHTVVASAAQQSVSGTTYASSTSGNQTLTVTQASQTISFPSITDKTFGDPDITLAATATSGLAVSYAATGNCAVAGNTLSITGAGSCTVIASQAGNTNYSAAPSVPQSFNIDKATATLAIDPTSLSATYDGNPHSAIVTTTPAGLTVVAITYAGGSTAPASAGTYAVVAKLTNNNYSASDATGSLVIGRATPTFSNLSAPAITFTDATATISGTLKAGTQSATGTVGITVAGPGGAITGSAALDAAGNFTTTVPTSTLPANLTGYDVALSVPQSTNFNVATDNTLKLVVNRKTQTITFGTLAGKTYGDAPFSVSATASSGLTVAFSASGQCSVSGTTVTISGAGNCTVTSEQVGDGNVDPAPPVPQSFSIGKATATINVTGFSGIYDGAAHGATGTATGVGGADLSSAFNLGASFTNVPGGTANWTFDAGANYNTANGSATITITAATGSVSITAPATITFGQSGAISATKVGDGSVTYAATAGGGSVCNVDATTGAVSMLTGTGDCTVQATLSAGQNYTGATSNQVTIAAAKATATINVTGYTGVYDGAAHGATGTATGLGGANLSAQLDLGGSFTDVPGGTANWTFAGGNDYNSQNGTAAIVINKADQTSAVVLSAPTTMTYGQAAVQLTATGGNGTGVYVFSIGGSTGCSLAGNMLSVVNASSSCAVTAIRSGDNNYNASPSTGPSDVALVKANATVSVNGFTGQYDAQPHGATGTATGVLGENLAAQLSLGATFTNVTGGTANWTFAGGSNYNSQNGAATITIDPKPASVTPAAGTKVFGENDPPLTGSLSGFIGSDNVSATYSRVGGENVVAGGYAISAVLTPTGILGNYDITYGTATFTITPATPTIAVTGGTFDYDGNDHPATGAVTGVAGANLGAPAFTYSKNGGAHSSTPPNGAGSYGVKANFAGGGNYTAAVEQTSSITITPKQVTASITAGGKTFDGNTSVTGAVGCSLSGVLSGDAGSTGCSATGASFDAADAGSRTVTATVGLTGASAPNYLLTATSVSVGATIAPAPTTTTVTVSDATYDATPHGGTAQVTGPMLSQSLTVNYVGINGTSYPSSTTAPTNAGDYSASASFPLGGNYLASADTKTFIIGKRSIGVKPTAPDLIWTGSPLTPTYSLAVATGSLAGSDALSSFGAPIFSPTTVTPVGTHISTVSGLTSGNYAITPMTGTVIVLDQTVPTGSITQLNPVPIGTAASLVVNFTDVTTGNSPIVAWKYSFDGVYQPVIPISAGPNTNQTKILNPINTTDVIQICVQGQDAGGNWSVESCALLAIYDPSAGFVTGGGWINSPAGAYRPDVNLFGKANFGFVSKYQKGANVPTGNTEFQFKEGNLNFKSTNFQWLVIQGTSMAQFKGTGTINGAGSYNFMVTANDGDALTGAKKPDSFRMKITDAAGNVVYDNQNGALDTSAAATDIGGGSIQIQSK